MHHHAAPSEDPLTHWEARYAGPDAVWSGRENATTAAIAGSLPVGRVLDLGCGEGGDALWLARLGWRVTAIDLSPTAIRRGAAAAAEQGVADRITWTATDLGAWTTDDRFDLVTASFLHSTVALPRIEILRRAAATVVGGGHLLVVSHAAPPPWHRPDETGHPLGTMALQGPQAELEALELPTDEWTVVLAEVRQRPATGPNGEHGLLDDGVILLQRR